jgi:hypothetical protein
MICERVEGDFVVGKDRGLMEAVQVNTIAMTRLMVRSPRQFLWST